MAPKTAETAPEKQISQHPQGVDRGAEKVPRCGDFDADCDDVEDKVWCWLYDPAKGYCPFLRTPD